MQLHGIISFPHKKMTSIYLLILVNFFLKRKYFFVGMCQFKKLRRSKNENIK